MKNFNYENLKNFDFDGKKVRFFDLIVYSSKKSGKKLYIDIINTKLKPRFTENCQVFF